MKNQKLRIQFMLQYELAGKPTSTQEKRELWEKFKAKHQRKKSESISYET